jgi:hypothetical protein
MRAGYDRVYADVRRPMIPDLPVPPKRQPEEIPDESGKALAVILAVLVFLLFFAIATGFYTSHTRPTLTEAPRHVAFVTTPDGGRDQSTGPTYPNSPSRTP